MIARITYLEGWDVTSPQRLAQAGAAEPSQSLRGCEKSVQLAWAGAVHHEVGLNSILICKSRLPCTT
jgi:hypothetical protein